MSAEQDNHLQPSATEAVTTEVPGENSSDQNLAQAAPQIPSAKVNSGSSSGAATAAVRAPESVEASPLNTVSPQEMSGAQRDGSESAAGSAPESTPTADHSETSEASPAATASQSTETAEAEASETMDQLLDQFAVPEPAIAEGEIFDGRVLAVTDLGVIVDVGGKFEGLVPAQEFVDSGSPIQFGKGQTIEVERLHEQKNGYVLLSHVRAHRRRVWERIEKSYREQATITGKVTERIKGGLVVDIGVRAFLPASQIELRPVHDLETWKDRDIEVRVLKLNRKRGNVVVSRRAILEEEQKSKRDALMASLSENSVVTGRVKNVTDYGVFVDLGGIYGLLHVSDLVWGRVPHPSSIVKAGDDLEVQI